MTNSKIVMWNPALINKVKKKCLAKEESGWHGTKTKGISAEPERGLGVVGVGEGVTTCTVETATSINHCLQKENRG